MDSFLDTKLVQPGTEIKAGTPGYTDAVVQNTARSLKRPYQAALEDIRQSAASRGNLEGGQLMQSEGDLGQSYLDRLSSVAEKSAMHSADLAEQDRIRKEQRGWAVEDMNRRYAELEAEAGGNKWSNLLGGLGAGVGTAIGGPLVGAGIGAVSGMFKPKKVSPSVEAYDPEYTDKNSPWASDDGGY